MEFKDLTPYQEAFELYLQKEQIERHQPLALFSPIHYIMSIGGKRIRPILTLLAYRLFADDYDRAFAQALAIEIFHNFSLVHDDIMDAAPTRRGFATVHQKFDINAAILSGDAMLIMAYQYLIQGLKPDQIHTAVDLFSSTALDICRGQQLDIDFEKEASVSIDDYLQMIEYKTAVLLGLSMSLGATVAEAGPDSVLALNSCGVAAGLAFQIHDDYLDAFGNTQLTGKQRGGDIIQNKKTFLWIKAYHLGDDRIKQELLHWDQQKAADPHAKVRRILEIYQALDIEGHCHQQQLVYTKKAIEALDQVAVPDPKKQKIFDLITLLLSRSH